MKKDFEWLNRKLFAISKSFIVLNTFGWFLIYAFNILTRLPYLNTLTDYMGLTSYYVFGYLVSFLLRLFLKRINLEEKSVLKLGFYVFIASFIYGSLWFLSDLLFSIVAFGFERYKSVFAFPNYLLRTFLPTLIMLVWSSTYFIIKLWQRWETERKRLREAEILLQESELKLLRYQVNPHFLFNSLNSIRALTLKDPLLVRGMVTELSEFLKYSLLNKNNKEVSLEEELKSIDHYIKIEKYRFDENLIVDYEIDHFAEEYPVPVMILHPVVENAVKYGMKTSIMPLKIKIEAKVKNDELFLEIRNSGKWFESDEEKEKTNSTNTGLENVRSRLENTYGADHKFDIVKGNEEIVIKIQLKKKLENDSEKEA